MEVKRGFGFQGVVMYDDAEDQVQCHLCGKWFESVGSHLTMTHHMSSEDYKVRYGLTLGTALCSRQISNRNRQVGLSRVAHFNRVRNVWSKTRKPRRFVGCAPRGSMQMKNSVGLCDLQVRSRYDIVKAIVRREPTFDDLDKYDSKLGCWIRNHHGSINKYRASIGVKERYWAPVTLIECVAALRKCAKDKRRMPYTTDFQYRGAKPHAATILNRFGSWANALRTAGLK